MALKKSGSGGERALDAILTLHSYDRERRATLTLWLLCTFCRFEGEVALF
jgi:hypothetical protein